jgi:Xaa-Pro dipeptidase
VSNQRNVIEAMPTTDLNETYLAHLRTMEDRLTQALETAGLDGLVILAGELTAPPRDDVDYPFRVEPYFAAWAPLATPGAALVLTPGKRPSLLYPQPTDFWHEPPQDPTGPWVEHFDIRILDASDQVTHEVSNLPRTFGVIGSTAIEAQGPRNAPGLLAVLDYFRAFKTDYEIECVAAANAIAARGHQRVRAAFDDGISEFDLNSIYCDATRHREAELPYQNIVALNEHAATLHYQHLDRNPPATVRSLLIDAGATASGYGADVTRTWTYRDSPLQPIIDDMDVLQQTVCSEARAGVDFVALNERAHELLAGVLANHEIVTCTAEDAYASGLTRAFLPHGLGHLLGLQVHDPGGHQIAPTGEVRTPPAEHPFLRLTRVLQPGFVVTIEPGLYWIDSLLNALEPDLRAQVNWQSVARLRPFGGIRIEDNVCVEASGHRNLTRRAFGATGANIPPPVS